MVNFKSHFIVKAAADLGARARLVRKNAGISQKEVVMGNSFGLRFLSEFENGKPTSQIGKIIEALHAVGLDLAVIERSKTKIKPQAYSAALELEFPYDWSNPNMDESTLIGLVLDKGRFNDILKITHAFGINCVEDAVEKIQQQSKKDLAIKYLRRIAIGFEASRASQ